MKRIFLSFLAVLMLAAGTVPAWADYDPQVDYMAIMIKAASEGDMQTGLEAEKSRSEKMDDMGIEGYEKISFEDLYLLGKIIYAEAGSVWLSDEWKMCVGEVVLNRVASEEFPDTISEVLAQPGQYYENNKYFRELKPTERCVSLALRLLEGERVLDDESVVFQANFVQGSGTHTSYYDSQLGWTYFCHSSRMNLYAA